LRSACRILVQVGLKMSYIIAVSVIASILIIDLLSKTWAAADLAALTQPMQIIPGIVDFRYVKNTGAAFGFLGDWEYSIQFFIVVTSVSLLVFLFVLWRYGRNHALLNLSFALIIGGALGNFIDRIYLGYVRDFICFSFLDGFSFNAVFNVADASLTIGVVLFAVYFLFFFKDAHFNYKSVNAQTVDIESYGGESDAEEGNNDQTTTEQETRIADGSAVADSASGDYDAEEDSGIK